MNYAHKKGEGTYWSDAECTIPIIKLNTRGRFFPTGSLELSSVKKLIRLTIQADITGGTAAEKRNGSALKVSKKLCEIITIVYITMHIHG